MDLPVRYHDVNELPKPIHRKGISSFVKAGISLIVTANIDMLVAFSTGYWATWKNAGTNEYGGYGLWMYWKCTNHIVSDGVDIKEERVCSQHMADLSFPAWYVTTQVFMTLTLAGFLASLILLLVYMFLPGCARKSTLVSSLIGVSYSSGLFLVVGLVVFGFKVAEDIEEMNASEWFLSWSFTLACTAFVLNQIAASLLITENKRVNNFKDDHGKTMSDDLKEDVKAILADERSRTIHQSFRQKKSCI